MNAINLQKKIDLLDYCDARVNYLNCNYFADEITLAYDLDDTEVVYIFKGCYKSIFDHVKDYDKLRPVKEMTIPQIPYFIQDVKIDSNIEDGVSFYVCKMNVFPLYIEIWCKDIDVSR